MDELLRLPDIDLVIVSSPDELHADHALAALRAGKHVVIDKPFATNLPDARRIAAEADRQNRLVTAFHNRRWDADFRTLQALLDAGTLGEIVTFESHFDRWRPHVAPVWKEARAGGSWLDLGPHLVDQALLLFGRPLDIYADIGILRHGAQAPDYFHVILRYERMRAILHSSKMTAQHGLRFVVHGTGGSWIKQGIDPQEAAIVAGASPAGDDWGVDPCDGLLTRPDKRHLLSPSRTAGEITGCSGSHSSRRSTAKDPIRCPRKAPSPSSRYWKQACTAPVKGAPSLSICKHNHKRALRMGQGCKGC